MTFGVITKIPDSETEDGNLASPIVYRLPPELTYAVMVNGRIPVFSVGEILVLDDSGREISGQGRKPSKWLVTCEHFDAIDKAIERALAVMAAEGNI